MMACQKSACLDHSQNDCSGKSDLNGECEWDSGMNKCLRKKSCADNSGAETCNAVRHFNFNIHGDLFFFLEMKF